MWCIAKPAAHSSRKPARKRIVKAGFSRLRKTSVRSASASTCTASILPGASKARLAPLTSKMPRSRAAKRRQQASGESLTDLSPPLARARLATRAKPASVGAPSPSSCQVIAQCGSLAAAGGRSSLMEAIVPWGRRLACQSSRGRRDACSTRRKLATCGGRPHNRGSHYPALPSPARTFMRWFLPAIAVAAFLVSPAAAQVLPHHQDRPPGPALSPQVAMAKMTVPEGFRVELVASEPDIVNPVAMTFDEKGRIWITESLEYPRKQPGPGRDRVKVLEDTNGDGKADRFREFAGGLNIPSGIAVGHGGVWVANSPDILFYPDANGDGTADGPPKTIVSGFGRSDTHELPNSLTWGPDGWLYGLNGVFNGSHVKYAKDNPNFKPDHPGWQFTCALWRIHPVTREFEIFCEGTSNPWGLAFDHEGSAFVSACVIDHLWHLVETGYYHRQGGPYPPFTWKIDSIVKHTHQKAAYCGIHYFDSDAYPEPYRNKLYMGNIHGGCINVDKLQRDGSTYFATGEPDFLTANDAWFMPVVQKTGPDGCLYILDWYDRYHCYQDANRDSAGIDRLKGRLYRVRYKDTPRAKAFDLAKETDEQLFERLGSGNGLFRDLAIRLLTERNVTRRKDAAVSSILDAAMRLIA